MIFTSWLLVVLAGTPLIPPAAPRTLSPIHGAVAVPRPFLAPWSPNINLVTQPESQSQNETSVSQSGFRLVAAWNDYRGAHGVTVGVAYSRTAGTSWSPDAFPLEDSSFPEEGDPSVAFGGGDTVYLVGIAFDREEGRSDIVMSRSFDGGRTWGLVENLTNTPAEFDDKCWISAYHDTLFVVYASFGYPWGIRLLVSTDAGETWQGPFLVHGSGNGAIPRMDGQGNLHVVWGLDGPSNGAYMAGIWLKTSTDLGHTFGPLRWVADFNPDTLLPWRAPALPAFQVDRDSGFLYVAYASMVGESSRVFFKRSVDGGQSFEPKVAVAPNIPGHQIFPALTVDAEHRIHLFYLRARQENDQWLVSAWHVASEDYGVTWGEATMVSDTEAAPAWSAFIGDYIDAASNEGFVGVVWPQRGPFSDDVWFSRQVLDTLAPGIALDYAFAGDTLWLPSAETLWIDLSYPDPQDVAVVHLLLVDSLFEIVDTMAEVIGPDTLVAWALEGLEESLAGARIVAVAHDVAWNAGVDTGGVFDLITGVAEPLVAEPVQERHPLRIWPNPFSQGLYLEGLRGSAEVWDAQGRRVARLQGGPARVYWPAVGENGLPLASGVYLIRTTDRRVYRVLKLR